jgi:hypothetical protein
LLDSKIKEQPYKCHRSDVCVIFIILKSAMPQADRDGEFFLFFSLALYGVMLNQKATL